MFKEREREEEKTGSSLSAYEKIQKFLASQRTFLPSFFFKENIRHFLSRLRVPTLYSPFFLLRHACHFFLLGPPEWHHSAPET